MKKAEGVIFDMDGLIFDTERLSLSIYRKIFKKYGYILNEDVFMSIMGRDREDIRQIYMDNYGRDLPLDKIFKEKDKETLKCINENGVPIKSGVYEILNFLNEGGYKTALATSSMRKRTDMLMETAGIRHMFSAVVCGDEVEKSKPNPEIFLKAAKKLNLDPGKCIVLEDSPAGITAAARAGMIPINIPDLKSPDDEMREKAYRIFSSLSDVVDYLKNAE
ncbi:MAG: HAD family phosphatase [Bacillota bacterium]|nr:HAD family phosphatase [Bacillota bacterium]